MNARWKELEKICDKYRGMNGPNGYDCIIATAPEEYDRVLIHQANAFMLRKLTKILGFEKEQVPMSIHEYGNTSSACIPVTITSQLKDVELDKVMMVGMGAGLASCIADISLKGMKNFGIKELDA